MSQINFTRRIECFTYSMEQFKDIEGFENIYSITSTGRVWSHPKSWARTGHKGKFLKTWLIGHGYPMVMLYKNKKTTKILVHRLVAQMFIENPENKREVNHKNGNILDNRLENLEWVTSSENKSHAFKIGLRKVGDKLSWTKLKNKDIPRIRRLVENKKRTQIALALQYAVSPATISLIVNQKNWKHI